jgi:hypothetical protein
VRNFLNAIDDKLFDAFLDGRPVGEHGSQFLDARLVRSSRRAQIEAVCILISDAVGWVPAFRHAYEVDIAACRKRDRAHFNTYDPGLDRAPN